MATALIIALTLGYEHTVYQCFIHHLQESFDPITLYMSIYLLPSFHAGPRSAIGRAPDS